jgi:hypothetical protein
VSVVVTIEMEIVVVVVSIWANSRDSVASSEKEAEPIRNT